MYGQCAAVVGCNLSPDIPVSPQAIIKGILEVDDCVASSSAAHVCSIYKWDISNKYYEATVDLCHIEGKNLISQQFAEAVEAVIIGFDSKNSQCLEDLTSWLTFFNAWQPEIKLAVCLRCSSVDDTNGDYISREKALRWCLDNDFELVELDPVSEDYDEDEDFGITRIRKALCAHMWPDMKMKSQTQAKESNSEKETESATSVNDERLHESIEEKIDALLPPTDDFDDDFEALFQKMQVFKDSAANMSGSSRKDYAEKVVTAFWRAIGGDEDELVESSDESK